MKIALKLAYTLMALGVLLGLWNIALTLGARNSLVLVAQVLFLAGVTGVAACALFWLWFREG